MTVGTKNRPPRRRTMADNNITSRGADVHEALVNDPAKRGPHLPRPGGVPTPPQTVSPRACVPRRRGWPYTDEWSRESPPPAHRRFKDNVLEGIIVGLRD